MARGFRRSRRRGSSRSSRKTYWEYAIFGANAINFDFHAPGAVWVSAWARWPSGSTDPGPLIGSAHLVPEDETLVRTIAAWQVGVDVSDVAVPHETAAYSLCMGLIAFDGGRFPEFYDSATFTQSGSLVAPPHPILDATEDWILRMPVPGFFTNALGPDSAAGTLFNESRAKRKLPPGTGILAVVGGISLATSQDLHVLDWALDVRLALRSGYTR